MPLDLTLWSAVNIICNSLGDPVVGQELDLNDPVGFFQLGYSMILNFFSSLLLNSFVVL